MIYLGNPEGSLVTMWVAARHLAATGPAPEEELMAVLRPAALTRGDGLALQNSLKIGADLGVFEDVGDVSHTLTLGSDLSDSDHWIHEFRWFAAVARRRLVLQASGGPDGVSDIALLSAWLLSRPWQRPTNPLQYANGAPQPVTTNQAPAFRRWMRELGLLGSLGGGNDVSPDPTVAIRDEVESMGAGRFTASSFVSSLGIAVPTGPAHPLAVAASASGADTDVFPSVTFALHRLQEEGVLEMVVSDDAVEADRISMQNLADPRRTRGITHVEVLA